MDQQGTACATRKIRFYDPGSGMLLGTMDLPAEVLDPIGGLLFHPGFPTTTPGGFFGIIGGSGSSTQLNLFPQVAGETAVRTFAASADVREGLALVTDGYSGDHTGHLFVYGGGKLEVRSASSFALTKVVTLDCLAEKPVSLGQLSWRTLGLYEPGDGREIKITYEMLGL